MILGVLRENDDPRVALAPESIPSLEKLGIEVLIEAGVGKEIGFDYGVDRIHNRSEILSRANLFITFSPLFHEDMRSISEGAIFISRFAPYDHPKILDRFEARSYTCYSLDMIPRITVAQSSDVLSSLASLAGYKAVLLAANHFKRYLPMLTTAAGTIAPAKVLILGVGVAGLQAIATAKRLGAVVSAFDTRTATKTEVMSLGAKFIEVEGATDEKSAGGYAVEQSREYQIKQKKEIFKNIVKSDLVITTAQVRGKPAPRLIDREMLEGMATGSVIVDLASSTGGNCEGSREGETVEIAGITVIGDSDLSRKVPYHASLLFSKNVVNFLQFMIAEGGFDPLNRDHEVVKQSCIVFQGERV